jgi:hypothetical protein
MQRKMRDYVSVVRAQQPLNLCAERLCAVLAFTSLLRLTLIATFAPSTALWAQAAAQTTKLVG